MVCQGECFAKVGDQATFDNSVFDDRLQLLVGFKTFYQQRIGWRLQSSQTEHKPAAEMMDLHPTFQQVFNSEFKIESNLEEETVSLKQVKQLIDAYPLDLDRDVMNEIDVDTVLKYRSYIQKLPILIKLIDFCDHSKIRICYETLDMSSQAKETLAEEALALLDGQFGDIKVRIHAVKKLSMLTDSQIALLCPS